MIISKGIAFMVKCFFKSVLLASSLISGGAFAADAQPTSTDKNYNIDSLKMVVSNASQCKSLLSELDKTFKKAVTFQSAERTGHSSFNVTEKNNRLMNLTYNIAQENVNGNLLKRIGLGSFNIGKDKFDYVVHISVDGAKKDFRYQYPVIISNDGGECVYTAIVKPSKDTVEAFKKHINENNVANGKDIAPEKKLFSLF
jgi:hypothetical protein